MAAAKNSSSHEIPAWATALILLLVLAGGGWGMYRYFEDGSGGLSASAAMSLTDANVVTPPGLPRGPGQWQGQRPRPPTFGQFAAQIAAGMPDGVMPMGNGYMVKAGVVRLNVDRPNGNGGNADWRYRYSYTLLNMISPDDIDILRTARRAVNDPDVAKEAGVTADQVQQLRPLTFAGGMVVDQADREKIAALFVAWLSASGRSTSAAPGPATRPITAVPVTPQAKAAEQQLVVALADMGNRQMGPTRQSFAERAAKVHAILGDATLQKLKPTG
jgi:hypothetical protein